MMVSRAGAAAGELAFDADRASVWDDGKEALGWTVVTAAQL